MPSKRIKHKSSGIKFKILLDECMPPKRNYPNLNSYYDVKHCSHDYKMSSESDKVIYKRAKDERRIFVTFNTKHFKPLLTPTTPTVFALSTINPEDKADLQMCKILKSLKEKEIAGVLFYISSNKVEKKESSSS